MILESTSIIVSIVSALVGVGFTIGFNVGKYQTKEKCEAYRCTMECQFDEKLATINKDLLSSIIRIHDRLDQFIKGGCNVVQQKEISN